MSHSGNTTAPIQATDHGARGARDAARLVPSLSLLYAVGEEYRVGEAIAFRSPGHETFGRATKDVDSVGLERRRPGSVVRTGALNVPSLSRVQARFDARGDAIVVENVGRRQMFVNGERLDRAELQAGDVLEFEQSCAFVLTMAPPKMPALGHPYPEFPFGEADPFGIAGESAAIWAVRAQLAALAQQRRHVHRRARRGAHVRQPKGLPEPRHARDGGAGARGRRR